MARRERNSVDYFPHTVNHGKKMFYLRSKYKNDGYAVWFMLLEQLGKAEHHYLNLTTDIQIMYLSSEFMVDENVLKDIINILVKFGDFDADLWNNHNVIFNEKFTESVSDAYKKRNNACISKGNLYSLLGLPYPPIVTPYEPLGNLKGDGNTQRKEKKRKEDNIKEKGVEETPPSPPKKIISEKEKAKLSFENNKCVFGNDFKKSWLELIETKKWKNKAQSAIDASLKLLMKYDESFANGLVQKSTAGEYQGVVYADTDIIYQKFLNLKNGKPNSNFEKRADDRHELDKLAKQILFEKLNQMPNR